MNNLQALVDGMSAKWQRERAESQLTLGGMIESLESMPEDLEIKGLGDLDSYRGYYEDLSFSPTNTTQTVKEILSTCQSAMGKVFEGYKGGDFVMGALTPLWLADYGTTGDKIIGINPNGTIETNPDDT